MGPQSFVFGIGRGTKGLVKGIVTGALSSACAVVGTYTQSVSTGISSMGSEGFAQVSLKFISVNLFHSFLFFVFPILTYKC